MVTIDESGNISIPGTIDGYNLSDKFQEIDDLADYASEVTFVTKSPTGFPVPGGGGKSIITVDDSTRKLTITATNDTFNVWVKGVKYTITTASVTFGDEEGIHAFYFNDPKGHLHYLLHCHISLQISILFLLVLSTNFK